LLYSEKANSYSLPMKTMKFQIVSHFAILSLLLASGCATPPPTANYIRKGKSFSKTMPQVNRVAVLVDATVAYDRVGEKDYFVLEDSKVAAQNILEDAVSSLQAKGYKVVFSEWPFIGSFKSSDTPMQIAESRGEEPTSRNPPFFTSQSLAADEDYKAALIKVIYQMVQAVEQKGALPTEQFRTEPGIPNALEAIAEQTHSDYVLIAAGNGVIVSGGKQVGQEIGTTLLSSVMTLGVVSVSKRNISYLDSYVALIDSQSQEIVWSNSLRQTINPGKAKSYRGKWARNLLYYLPTCSAPISQAQESKELK
jgi:nucleotide-binding universal stress UspA family protein